MSKFNKHELGALIKSFVHGTCQKWEWDDFTSAKKPDEDIERVRLKLLEINKQYPAVEAGTYCNAEGCVALLEIADTLLSSNVLELRAVTRSFTQGGSTLDVLRGIDITIKRGEVVALVGESGSGKSTLLQIAGLLDTPTSGDIFIEGVNASKAGDAERTRLRLKHLGFIYQFHHLLPEFSARENIAVPQMIAGVSYEAAVKHADELLGSLGLSARVLHRPAALSGGEQQRVAIARALAGNPLLILADEPTGNLDPTTAESVFAIFVSLAKSRGLSALVATHNLELAKRMDRVVTLKGGKI